MRIPAARAFGGDAGCFFAPADRRCGEAALAASLMAEPLKWSGVDAVTCFRPGVVEEPGLVGASICFFDDPLLRGRIGNPSWHTFWWYGSMAAADAVFFGGVVGPFLAKLAATALVLTAMWWGAALLRAAPLGEPAGGDEVTLPWSWARATSPKCFFTIAADLLRRMCKIGERISLKTETNYQKNAACTVGGWRRINEASTKSCTARISEAKS